MPSFRCPHCVDAECLVLEARDLAGSHETVRFACPECGRAWRLEAIAPRERSGQIVAGLSALEIEPGPNWELSDETFASMKAIDENIAMARVMMRSAIID